MEEIETRKARISRTLGLLAWGIPAASAAMAVSAWKGWVWASLGAAMLILILLGSIATTGIAYEKTCREQPHPGALRGWKLCIKVSVVGVCLLAAHTLRKLGLLPPAVAKVVFHPAAPIVGIVVMYIMFFISLGRAKVDDLVWRSEEEEEEEGPEDWIRDLGEVY